MTDNKARRFGGWVEIFRNPSFAAAMGIAAKSDKRPISALNPSYYGFG